MLFLIYTTPFEHIQTCVLVCVCAYLVWLRKRQIKHRNFFFVYPSTIARCFSPTQMYAYTDKHFHLCSHSQLCTPALFVSLSLPLALSISFSLSFCLSVDVYMVLTPTTDSVYYLLSLTLTVQRRCATNNVCAGLCVHFDVSIHSRRKRRKVRRRRSSKNNLYHHLIQTLP